MRTALFLGISMAIAAPAAAKAQQSNGSAAALADALAQCRGQSDDSARLACFDRTAAALLAARDAGDVVMLDREGMRRAKRRVFGFQLPRLGLFGEGQNDASAKGEPEVKEIESTLTRVANAGNGLFVFVLGDESQWQTTETRSGLFPKAGQPIKIEAGILGSYIARLNNSNRAVKVKRIR